MPPHRLYVLRHAKSSWDDPALADHDRPLAARGHKAVKLLAEHVRKQGMHPDQVLCSTALRAQETLNGVDPGGEQLIEPELYGASAGEWIERLKRVPAEAESVMVVGHNPALQQLVLALAGPDGRVARKYPTGALATLTFDCQWSELEPGRAELTELVRPKDLD